MAIDVRVVSTARKALNDAGLMPSTVKLCQRDGRARLVVVAGEVGGRWSPRKEGIAVVPGMRDGRFTSAKVVRQRTSSVVQTLELSFGVFHSKGSRFILVRGEGASRRWGPGAFHQ